MAESTQFSRFQPISIIFDVCEMLKLTWTRGRCMQIAWGWQQAARPNNCHKRNTASLERISCDSTETKLKIEQGAGWWESSTENPNVNCRIAFMQKHSTGRGANLMATQQASSVYHSIWNSTWNGDGAQSPPQSLGAPRNILRTGRPAILPPTENQAGQSRTTQTPTDTNHASKCSF